MMDLSLDHKQAKALNCSQCDPAKMRLRNCNGAFGEKSQSPILVNGSVYRICPRSIVAQDWELGYLISLYFDCRENKTTPFGGGLLETTAFCKEVFDLMDSIVSEFRERENKKMQEQMKKDTDKAKSKTKRGKR
jgi:hypothetical protein